MQKKRWSIGFPLNPAEPIEPQIEWGKTTGFDYVELFLEPPLYSPEKVDTQKIGDILSAYCEERIGHTPWYLPLCSPIQSIRIAAIEETKRYIDILADLEADRVTVHIIWTMPGTVFPIDQEIEWTVETLSAISDYASARGVRPMIETVGDRYQTPRVLNTIIKNVGRIWINCDVAHVLRGGHDLEEFLKTLKKRIIHAHFHDTRDGKDHLPLGVSMQWRDNLLLLKKHYKGTITLEVFGARELLETSLLLLRQHLDN